MVGCFRRLALRQWLRVLGGAALLFVSPFQAFAEPTNVSVRVLGKGSTFVGSGTGGMQITLTDADSGEVLAEGPTVGTSGDGNRIMGSARHRDDVLHTDGSAVFTAVLDIEEPTLVRLRAFGPIEREGNQIEVTSSHWVLPGKHLTAGNGWLVEVPGFLIEPIWPTDEKEIDENLPLKDTFRTHITPMCGCAIKPGGHWPPERYEVTVNLLRNGKTSSSFELAYGGQPSLYSAPLTLNKTGEYEAIISIYDPKNGNAGVKKVRFSVVE